MLELIIEKFIFMSRWIQAPVYIGLIAASLLYAFKFMLHLWHLITGFSGMDENTIMLSVLGLIDISMVINLLVVVIIGGYYTFVSKIHFNGHEDRPEWLDRINASTLKIKLIVSLVSISGVHLLKTFVDIQNIAIKDAVLQISIHLVFLVSALMLAWTDRVMHADEIAMDDHASEH